MILTERQKQIFLKENSHFSGTSGLLHSVLSNEKIYFHADCPELYTHTEIEDFGEGFDGWKEIAWNIRKKKWEFV